MPLDILWNIASFIIALSLLVAVHEYGHFWVARKCGVKVKRFSIGFGKVLFRKTDRHHTEFVLSLIPLGGYVQMLDGRVDQVSESEKQYAFNYKNVYQRFAIIAAGPLANFIFAVIAFYFMFLIGVPNIKPIVGEVTPSSIAAEAELPQHSQITAVNNIPTENWQDVTLQLVASIGNERIEITAKHADSDYKSKHELNIEQWGFKPESNSALTTLGIMPFTPKVHTTIAEVVKGKPAEKAGILAGDTVTAINGNPTNNDWQLLSSIIQKNANNAITVELLRSGELLSVVVTPEGIERSGKTVGYIGAAPTVDNWPDKYQQYLQYDVIDAIGKSVDKTWSLITLSFEMIGKLITGDVSIKNLSGPVAIAQGAGDSASYGLVYFLSFLALISINLGIINLLPLPVLDGGHLFYYVIEIITGKPVPEKIQAVGFKFGSIALLMLMTVAIFNDIARF